MRVKGKRQQYNISNTDGLFHRFYGSQLVLITFVGPCPDGMESCHKDGNCLNDALYNLYWGTRAENIQDAINHGTWNPGRAQGENNGHAKISDDEVEDIKDRKLAGESSISIADYYNVSRQQINNIVNGKSRAN